MNLDAALTQFEAADTNLARLKRTWSEMRALIPEGIVFLAGSDAAATYSSLRLALEDLAGALPPIDGHTLVLEVPDPDHVAQDRLDARDLGEPAAIIAVERGLDQPTEAIAAYRFRLQRARRALVRRRMLELLRAVDDLLAHLVASLPSDRSSVADEDGCQRLRSLIAEAERLVGDAIQRSGRWSDLRRHLSFAQGVDLHDIANHDWPSVRQDFESAIYGEREPLPIEADDLGALAHENPPGAVSSALNWDVLDDEGFERLLFALVSRTSGYENAQWLTKTNAPDRARDLSADRVVVDRLTGRYASASSSSASTGARSPWRSATQATPRPPWRCGNHRRSTC